MEDKYFHINRYGCVFEEHFYGDLFHFKLNEKCDCV